MTFKLSRIPSDIDNLSELISNLKVLDTQRNRLLLNFRFEGNPSVEELARSFGPIQFLPKLENHQSDSIKWGNLAALTTIDYMKKFNFMGVLDVEDRIVLIKNSFTDFDMLSNARRSFDLRKAESSFPDGSDIFVKIDHDICNNLENKIRCRLIGRLCDLKITAEEFLLLTSVFFCNPGTYFQLIRIYLYPEEQY
ncbi:unnamed protein product [Caenorhabditis nigoni]